MKNNNTRYLIVIALISICSYSGLAQQFPYLSGLSETRYAWNPANLNSEGARFISIYSRQQWFGLGIDNAPRYLSAHAQFPFEDYNMSGSAGVYRDKTGPISATGFVINYAYHLQNILTDYGQLTFGISASANGFAFDPTDEFYRDQDDPLLIPNRSSSFYPSVGGGLRYISSTKPWGENYVDFGFSAFQAFSTNVLIQNNNFQRQLHLFGYIGTALHFGTSKFEPTLYANYTQPDLISFILMGRYELEDTFWLGAGFSSVNDAFLQGGFILPGYSDRKQELRIGIVSNINIGQEINQAGPGVELYLHYGF